MDTKPTLGEALQDWMGMTEAQKDQQRMLNPTRSASLDRLLEKRRELAAKYRQPPTTQAPQLEQVPSPATPSNDA